MSKSACCLSASTEGRLRERRPKRGRPPAGQKRRGYHTDWREPTQIVIQWLDADGGSCKHTVPLYDATMADIDAAFELLEGYLRQIDASKADFVVFCADGARPYWKRFSSLAKKTGNPGALRSYRLYPCQTKFEAYYR